LLIHEVPGALGRWMVFENEQLVVLSLIPRDRIL
jgi:hypothetical protein